MGGENSAALVQNVVEKRTKPTCFTITNQAPGTVLPKRLRFELDAIPGGGGNRHPARDSAHSVDFGHQRQTPSLANGRDPGRDSFFID